MSPRDERTTANESPRVGAGVFSSPSMCLCTHRETLQVGVHRCLPCVYTESLKHSRVCFGRSAERHVPYEPEKRSPLTSWGATPLSGESTLGKHQCAMGKSFRFQPHSGSVFSTGKRLASFLILSDCRCGDLIKLACSARSLRERYNYRFIEYYFHGK